MLLGRFLFRGYKNHYVERDDVRDPFRDVSEKRFETTYASGEKRGTFDDLLTL